MNNRNIPVNLCEEKNSMTFKRIITDPTDFTLPVNFDELTSKLFHFNGHLHHTVESKFS